MLNQFEKAKDWSDLINWLQKVFKALKKSKYIPLKDVLSKRLGKGSIFLSFNLISAMFESNISKRRAYAYFENLFIYF